MIAGVMLGIVFCIAAFLLVKHRLLLPARNAEYALPWTLSAVACLVFWGTSKAFFGGWMLLVFVLFPVVSIFFVPIYVALSALLILPGVLCMCRDHDNRDAVLSCRRTFFFVATSCLLACLGAAIVYEKTIHQDPGGRDLAKLEREAALVETPPWRLEEIYRIPGLDPKVHIVLSKNWHTPSTVLIDIARIHKGEEQIEDLLAGNRQTPDSILLEIAENSLLPHALLNISGNPTVACEALLAVAGRSGVSDPLGYDFTGRARQRYSRQCLGVNTK